MNFFMLNSLVTVPDTARYMIAAYLVIGLMIAGYVISLVWRRRRLDVLIKALKSDFKNRQTRR